MWAGALAVGVAADADADPRLQAHPSQSMRQLSQSRATISAQLSGQELFLLS